MHAAHTAARTAPFDSAHLHGWLSHMKPGRGNPNFLPLALVLAYWCYLMVWRLVRYSVLNSAVPEAPTGPSATTYLVSDLLLLPVLLLFCRGALLLGVRHRLWWLIPAHFVLGLIFAGLR